MTAQTAVTAAPGSAMVTAVAAALVTARRTAMVAGGYTEMAGATAVPGGMLPAGRRTAESMCVQAETQKPDRFTPLTPPRSGSRPASCSAYWDATPKAIA